MKLTRRSFFRWCSAAIAGVVGTSAAARSKDVFRLPRANGIENGSVRINFNALLYGQGVDLYGSAGIIDAIRKIMGDRIPFQLAGQIVFPVYDYSGAASMQACVFLVDPNDREAWDFGGTSHMAQFDVIRMADGWGFEPSVRAKSV